MGIGSILKSVIRGGGKSADDAFVSTKAIGGSGSVKVSKVDPLDPAGTHIKAAASEPNLKNIFAAESHLTMKPMSSVDDVGKIAAKQANETANNILKSANKNTSVLGSLGKLAGGASLGVLAGAALMGSSSVLAGSGDPPQQDGMPDTVKPTTDKNGNPTYIYQTGNKGVDEALGWLQDQIDEIVTFLSSLLGGEGSGGSGSGGSLVLTDDTTTGEAGGKKKLLIVGLGLVIVAIAAYFLMRKKGGSKKGGSKK